MAFNERLREARNAKGYTQEQLGNLVGVAKSTIAGYESGNSQPDISRINELMRALDVDANYLWQDEMSDFPEPTDTKKAAYISEEEYADGLVEVVEQHLAGKKLSAAKMQLIRDVIETIIQSDVD